MRAPLLAGSSFTAALALVALSAPGAGAAGPFTVVSERFAPASAFVPPAAVSFAPDLVPYGSTLRAVVLQVDGHTRVRLTATGLAPGHSFPAHVHTRACDAVPTASGPHYQDRVDPVQPSTDPGYANERNELHLLLSTDQDGNGEAVADVDWTFRPGEANSVVLHAGSAAGQHAAGERVACLNVPF
ncbi:superoxide dismutase family protein [Kitasatospora azatica]|uniref:hypothetical protein n=1 Tax=Kitasatospora azatica TaxID=58347 RepID=UPI00055FBB8D|nr:hypothetical protein [Kitasatospora azatica]